MKEKGGKVVDFRPFSLKGPLMDQEEGWELGARLSKGGLVVVGPLEAITHLAVEFEARAQEES